MHRRALAVVILAALSAGCASHHPSMAPLPVGAMQFVAAPRPDTIVEGRFAGSAALDSGWIRVTVTDATFSLPPGTRDRWRSLSVRAFLAMDYGLGTWKAPVESAPVLLWPFLDFPRNMPSTRFSLTLKDPLRFLVAVPPGADLAKARLAFQVEWVTLFKEPETEFGETESDFSFSGPLTFGKPPSP